MARWVAARKPSSAKAKGQSDACEETESVCENKQKFVTIYWNKNSESLW